MTDKLLDEFTFKCTRDIKLAINSLANAKGISASELMRQLVDQEIERNRIIYESLRTIFDGAR